MVWRPEAQVRHVSVRTSSTVAMMQAAHPEISLQVQRLPVSSTSSLHVRVVVFVLGSTVVVVEGAGQLRMDQPHVPELEEGPHTGPAMLPSGQT